MCAAVARAGRRRGPAAPAAAKRGVLFVCLGNICRSPTAEAMFTYLAEEAGVAGDLDIDSCGTGGGNPSWYERGVNGFSYHEGDPADPRMTRAAAARGVKLTSRSRPLRPADFSRFDYIVGMEEKNRRAMLEALEYWERCGEDLPEDARERIVMMADYCRRTDADRVPDPYFGGAEGFETVLDLLDDACGGLLEDVVAQGGRGGREGGE